MARRKRQTFEEELDSLFLETIRIKKEHPNVVDRVVENTRPARRPRKRTPAADSTEKKE